VLLIFLRAFSAAFLMVFYAYTLDIRHAKYHSNLQKLHKPFCLTMQNPAIFVGMLSAS